MENIMDEISNSIKEGRNKGVEISLQDHNLIIIKDNIKYNINLMEGCIGCDKRKAI